MALQGPIASTSAPVGAAFGAAYGWAGTLTDVVAETESTTVRFAGGHLRAVGPRQPGSELYNVGQPGVGVRVIGSTTDRHLQLVVNGLDGPELGPLPSTLNVDCPGQCQLSDAGLLGDCTQCNPRSILLVDWELLSGGRGLSLLILDVKDGVTRLYLKTVALPLVDPINDRAGTGSLGGVDAGPVIDRRVSGVVQSFSGTPIGGVQATLTPQTGLPPLQAEVEASAQARTKLEQELEVLLGALAESREQASGD